MKPFTAAALLLTLLSVGAARAAGTTLYVNRVVVAGPGALTMGDVLRVSGDVPEAAREALLKSVAVVSDRLLYVPTSSYRSGVESAFGSAAIVVGSYSIVIPRGSALEVQAYLVDRLAGWLLEQRMLPDAVTPISFSQVTPRGSPPQNGIPVYQVHRSADGGTDVTTTLGGAGDGSVTARFSISGAAASPAGDSVRAGTAVTVIFHKGPLTIEVPGRLLGTAAVGSQVSVTIPDSQRTFSGQMMDGKAVDVDLP